ncbi:MAG: ectonucleotide pyrophosphatase/phosphodiesterase [Bacteroidales bacterium]|nr:ectonucleotide pyrophosphatase/phosphodiesterase [Bacteroidales bacterium]
MKKLSFLILVSGILLNACTTTSTSTHDHYLVVLSLDGFRWDYANFSSTPVLDSIAAHGVKAERMIPSFPTTTFANHYTMATGLYPDHHGIIHNYFYAPDLDAVFNEFGQRHTIEDRRFYGGEPIWVTAEKQGMKTATCFWVGSESDVQGIRPSYWKPYEHHMPYSDRIDTVMYWLQLPPEQRPKLIMWYIDEPDSKGHEWGPESDSIPELISQLDSLLGVFINRMNQLPHAKEINFMVVSDHGMAQLDKERQLLLDHYIDTSLINKFSGGNPVMSLQVKEGKADELIDQLNQVPHIHYWKHGELPAHLNFGTHERTLDFTVSASDGYSLFWSWRISNSKGAHGYDPSNPDMHTIFYAIGPDFKQGYAKKPFQNIHLYPLMAQLLSLQPADTDGSIDSISDILLSN